MFAGASSALRNPARSSGIDVLRGVAVLAVVLYHFDLLPYGYLGVDLFFVLSGFLVSKPLIDGSTSAGRFVLSRGFKIWPSYYAFLGFGTLAAWLLFRHSQPAQIITLAHAPRYLFFYQNYRGTPHWAFDHVWSLCVEEHFYLLLPLVFLVARGRRRVLLVLLVTMAAGSSALRAVGHLIGKDYPAATHSCLDGLVFGVLVRLVVESAGRRRSAALKRSSNVAFVGVVILIGAVTLNALRVSPWFDAVAFHTVARISFAFILLNLHAWDLREWRLLRFVSYYSYNWYLWHPICVVAVRQYMHSLALALPLYVAASFALAVAFTTYVEEPCLRLRSRIMGRRLVVDPADPLRHAVSAAH